MKDSNTTIAGIGVILAGLASATSKIAAGDFNNAIPELIAIITGAGLIAAKDATKDEAVPSDPVDQLNERIAVAVAVLYDSCSLRPEDHDGGHRNPIYAPQSGGGPDIEPKPRASFDDDSVHGLLHLIADLRELTDRTKGGSSA